MSLTRENLMDLMAYADGELASDDEGLVRVDALLRDHEEARRVVASMGVLSDWVRGDLTKQTSIARADDLADVVMRKISHQAGGGVVPLRRKAAATGRRLRRVAAGGLVGVLALAAGIALVAHGRGPLLPSASPSPEPPRDVARNDEAAEAPTSKAGGNPAAPGPPAEFAAAEPIGAGVDVDKVESNSRPFSVFYLPAVSAAVNSNVSSVVVWIGDDKKGH